MAARLFVRSIERRLPGGNAGPMPVFFALSGGQERSQKELAQIALVEQPTMAATLKRMERDGLIARRPDPEDGRSARIALTPQGEERAAQAFAAAAEVNALALEDLTEPERAQIVALMERVIATLRKDRTLPKA